MFRKMIPRLSLFTQGSYFRKSLILALLISCLPSLFVAFSSYMVGVHQAERELFERHQLKINQFSELLDKQFEQISIAMSRWSSSYLYSEYLRNFVFTEDISRSRELMDSLIVVEGSNVLIKGANLFLLNQEAIISSQGIEHLTPEEMKSYMLIFNQQKGLFLTSDVPLQKEDRTATSAIAFKLPWYAEQPFGAIVVTLNQEELEQSIELTQDNEQETAFLIRKSGEWITRPADKKEPLADVVRSEVLGRNESSSSYFTCRWEGETYLISFSEISQADWVYVAATPMNGLTQPVVRLSRSIIIFSLVGLLSAVLLSWFASSRLYKPIRRLVKLFDNDMRYGARKHQELDFIESRWREMTQVSETLQERWTSTVPALKEGFLLQLVQGHLYAVPETALKQRLEGLGWSSGEQRFTLLLIQLSGLDLASARFKEGDRQLVTFAAANIATELAAQRALSAESVNFQNLSVGLLCSVDSSMSNQAAKTRLLAFAQELISALGGILKLNVTIMVSGQASELSRVSEQLEQARQAMRYRNLSEAHQVIDLEAFEPSLTTTVQYPFEKEKDFFHAMRMGLIEESEEAFQAFIIELEMISNRELMVQQSMLQMLGNLRHMFIELGFMQHPLFHEGNLFEELLGQRDLPSMKKWFTSKIINPFLEEFQRVQNVGSRRIVEQVTGMLADHYREDLSLEACAEQFHTSPYTLSRAFKQILGINYVDYLQRLRMDKAKDLLISTTLKIQEVADKVGYQHSYFNKVFKTETGLTPTQYREKFRSGQA